MGGLIEPFICYSEGKTKKDSPHCHTRSRCDSQRTDGGNGNRWTAYICGAVHCRVQGCRHGSVWSRCAGAWDICVQKKRKGAARQAEGPTKFEEAQENLGYNRARRNVRGSRLITHGDFQPCADFNNSARRSHCRNRIYAIQN